MSQFRINLIGPAPWGFRLVGGKDFDQPLTISRITPGSKADAARLCIGDAILSINGENTDGMTHLDAQSKIKGCVDELTFLIARSESKMWSPMSSEEGKQHPYKMNLASEQQRPAQLQRTHSLVNPPVKRSPGVSSPVSASGIFKAPIATVYAPSPSGSPSALYRRHSTSSIPIWPRVGPKELKQAAQYCAAGPVEVDVPGLRVLHTQFNSPLQLYSQQNIVDSLQGQISTLSPSAISFEPVKQPCRSVVDTESEVYKMLQENQEPEELPRQSASFRVLQEILESEGNEQPDKPSGFRKVKAPATKVGSSVGGGQKLPVCETCGSGIVGIIVKVRDKFRHPECYTCTDCGTNLKQKGHFFVGDMIYCEQHARERTTAPEGYDVVTVFPKS
ncbi:PDZ and LIM domain protein 1 isoform X1 [Stegostoma tigrinum]|uniref:PDZ and LIM domain protein 1 isoform X1 n=1 Tax=Stegostoma tigrinum TaxID=3053191 RepID=UPI00202B3CE9|nr:PDZ and LIM domain protein 1 isoform X1 [Stegostoma tigrinum]